MKDKNVAAILALFFGALGVHKFYLGRIAAGFFYLIFSFTFIPAMLGVIDFFVLALMDTDEFNRRYNGSHTLGPVVVNMLPPGQYHPPPAGYPYPHYGAPNPYGGPAQQGTGTGPHGAVPGGGYGQPHGGYGQPQGGALNPDELAQKLEKLNELRISGLLTEEEFQGQKAKLLGRL